MTTTLLAFASGVLTLGDMVLSLAISLPTLLVVYSFVEAPAQFMDALWGWLRFSWQAIAGLFMILTSIFVTIVSVLFRMGLKLLIGIVYLVFPVDLIPDFIIGLGQLDDLMVFIILFIWALSSGIRAEGISMIRFSFPDVPFPRGLTLWRDLFGF
ncbi:DUF1232 domain-containing protein [Hoeflea sp. AS60]|uniref:YkvA family protein n=1 Tax=Hoeflea sp. AS60 TaxID=3135780 RepID=UPI00316F450D